MDRPKIPEHLAIIPDGNRRWARQHGLTIQEYYDQGGDRLTEILEAAFNLGVTCVSIWIGSYSNLTARDKAQVLALKALYTKKFTELADDNFIHDNKIKIEVHGEWDTLLTRTAAPAIKRAMARTEHYNAGTLSILVGYDGARERGAALQSLYKSGDTIPAEPDKANKLLRHYAWTGHLPDVDLLIRTGASDDPHNSGDFLGFLVGNAQLVFPEPLWPDYTGDLLAREIATFADRERRLGS